MIPDTEIFAMTAANRRAIADVFDGLDEAQWRCETLCGGWTMQHMAAHLVQPMLVGFGRFVVTALRFRGDIDRTIDHVTRRIATRPRAELLALLRAHADDEVNPPLIGPMGQFADTCVHLRDIARPLGLEADVPVGYWRILLDYLTSRRVPPALVPKGRLDGLAFAATDTDWHAGSGERVSGPAEAIGMAVTGRPAALADLRGPGVDTLAARIGGG